MKGKPFVKLEPDPSVIHLRTKKLPDLIQDGLTEGMNFVHNQVPGAPTASRKPFPFVSARQYWWVRNSIQDGTLKVPYRRTNTMLRRIITEVKKRKDIKEGETWIGAIGTDVEYAPWVISSTKFGDRGPQAQYHKGTWFTLQEIVDKNFAKVFEIVKKHIKKL